MKRKKVSEPKLVSGTERAKEKNVLKSQAGSPAQAARSMWESIKECKDQDEVKQKGNKSE